MEMKDSLSAMMQNRDGIYSIRNAVLFDFHTLEVILQKISISFISKKNLSFISSSMPPNNQ